AVAEAPDHAFGIGRHQLAVPVAQTAVIADDNGGVVDRAAGEVLVALGHAANDRHSMLARGGAQRGEIAAADADRVVDQSRMELRGQCTVGTGPKAPDPGGVTRHERLGEDDKRRAGSGCRADPADRFVQAGIAIEHDGSLLDDREPGHRPCRGVRYSECRTAGRLLRVAGPSASRRHEFSIAWTRIRRAPIGIGTSDPTGGSNLLFLLPLPRRSTVCAATRDARTLVSTD